jgi:hypothetical protein
MARKVCVDLQGNLVGLLPVAEHVHDGDEQALLERSDDDGIPAHPLARAGPDEARVLQHALHSAFRST